MKEYLFLTIAALMPVAASVLFYILEKKTPFGRLSYGLRQVIYGIFFGALAVIGTEWGIPISGAQVNCRDAAVLTAGLMFGGPAGVIAGFIGGIERWVAVAWGVGTFTRVACTLSTIIAGIYAACLRRFMFEDKRPGWLLSLAIGVVMEVFHLTMVFITNMNAPIQAMAVVRACTAPMVAANGISVMLAAVVLTLLSRRRQKSGAKKARISQTIQRWLLIVVLFAFFVTSYFVFSLQDRLATSQADTQLDLVNSEVAADIEDASDANLLRAARESKGQLASRSIDELAAEYGVAEISLIGTDGVIHQSTVPSYVGFRMDSGEQSSAFLCLLGSTEEFVQSYGPITSDPSILRKYAGIKTDDGFLQIGYDADQFQDDIDAKVVGATKNRHVGETGYVLIFDSLRHIVSAPASVDTVKIENLLRTLTLPKEGTTFTATILDAECFCRYVTAEGYYIFSVLPTAEALQIRNIALYVNTYMEILVFAILFALIYSLIRRVVVDQIKKINASLARITGGDLDEVVNVRSHEEFASLSDDINTTVDTLKHYIADASARLDEELELAKDIQASALPNVFPAFPKRKDFDIHAVMDPAKEVGGDFYDFYMTEGEKLHFLVADVSGKGIPAAMFMMRAKTELKSRTESGALLSDVFTAGNTALCEGNDAGMFVTTWQGSIDLETGTVTYVNAGHNPPLVRHGKGNFEYVRTRCGFVLAGMEGVRYKTQTLQLRPGDTLCLYTDGVTEAQNDAGELFGEHRLLNAVNSVEFTSMEQLCATVKTNVENFVGDAPQFDDITILALRFIGKPEAPSIHFDEAKIADIPEVTSFVEGELEKLGCPMKMVTQMSIAIDEIYSNIVKYAYPTKPGPVTVKVIAKDDPRCVCLRFSDEGIPYNPLTKEDPDITLSADERSIGGLGIFMVKKTMDEMKYKYENDENILTLVKNW
ncbi:MAG: SpoIIE family protein phosphatase [Clostridia bacterium]|nr:SpoIIE family protein phosphatase [Clostridia bacterium]